MITYGITEQNKQPTPPARKPNEDCFGYSLGKKSAGCIAVVCDGIPVFRNARGQYPRTKNGATASHLAVETVLRYPLSDNLSLKVLNAQIVRANRAIKKANEENDCYRLVPSRYMATMITAVAVDAAHKKALIAHMGDSLVFYLPEKGTARLLTRDQLAPWHKHCTDSAHSPHPSGDPVGYTGGPRLWQDEHVRNKLHAKCWCGKRVRGWGALTGEESAISFLETKTFCLAPKGRIIVASDAFCVFQGGPTSRGQRIVAPYRRALKEIGALPPKEAVHTLLALTRKEEAKRTHSDDATFVVIDFEC